MNKLRTIAALALSLIMLTCPILSIGGAVQPEDVGDVNADIDIDGSDGYSGDYVIIYNPDTVIGSGRATGSLQGLIAPSAGLRSAAPSMSGAFDAELDIDSELMQKYVEAYGCDNAPFDASRGEADEHFVGDTQVFKINDYSPAGEDVEFKVVSVGEYCYVWTPAGDDEGLYPLDAIDESYADIVRDSFDSSYPLLARYIGEYSEGIKINLLYYNIEDGWTSGSAYIGGFFSARDCYANHLPMISIDTYPGVYHPLPEGGWDSRLSRSFGIAVHEYQHMINFLRVGNMPVWLNEAMSSAAEEFCYPGSCLVQRIPGWVNNNIIGNGQQLDPPAEYQYTEDFAVHNGASLYAWDDSGSDIGAIYGQAALFTQYLYSHWGNGIFKQILEKYPSCGGVPEVLYEVTGMEASELVMNFRIALTANDPEGEYSFAMQQGYDPEEYYGVANLYSWLAPVVYTGSGLTVYGGGAVTVIPQGGTYYPPEDADPGLRYVGVTLVHGMLGDVDMDGDVDSIDALMALRYSLDLVPLTNAQLRLGDVNGSGFVNVNDALVILRYALGLVHEF